MSQDDQVLFHLKSGRDITPREALDIYGCFRLAARIETLRKEGHLIETDIVKRDGKRWARYYIPRPVQLDLIA